MRGNKIPGDNNVSRLCSGTRCDEDGRPLGAAFMLKSNEFYLSVNWLEETGASSRAQQLAIVRKHLTDKGLTMPAKGRLAVLHLQSAFKEIKRSTPDSRALSAHHEPELPHDPSHSGVYGYIVDDNLIADLMAQAVREHYGARA